MQCLSSSPRRPAAPALCPTLNAGSAGLCPTLVDKYVEHSNALKRTWAWRLLQRMHESLPPHIEAEYVHSLRRLVSLRGAVPLHRWSMFAGGGVSSKLLQVYDLFLEETYNIHLKHKTTLLAEWDNWKQSWLKATLPETQVLVSDVNECHKTTIGENRMNGDVNVLIPHKDMGDGGIPCTVMLNCNSAKNINCEREQRESTGLGFSFLMKSVEVHGPVTVENECVDDLAQRSPANAPNDVEYMVDEYIRHGYWAFSCAVDSADYAGFVRRIRQWWAAVMVAQGFSL